MNRNSLLFATLLLFVSTRLVAQSSQFRFYDASPSGVSVEISPVWQKSIANLQKSAENAVLFSAITEGNWLQSANVDLPNLDSPKIELLEATYESFPLNETQKSDGFWQKTGTLPLAFGQIGISQKQPQGTLIFKSVVAENGELKRFTKIKARITFSSSSFKQAETPKYATISQLSSGKWFKIPITAEGVYKIDGAYLQSLGLSGEEANPAKVQVFANGGNALAASNLTLRPDDLRQISTWVEGSTLFFFADGLTGWNWNYGTARWEHWFNEFATENQVFIKVNATQNNVVSQETNTATTATVLNSIDGRILLHEDKINLGTEGGGGGDWYGEQLPSSQTKTLYDAILPNINGNQYSLRMRSAVASQNVTTVIYDVNGSIIGTNLVAPVSPSSVIKQVAYDVTNAFTISTNFTTKQTINYKLQNHSSDTQAWMDWVEIVYPQTPVATDNYLRFNTPGGRVGTFEWTLTGFSSAPTVWDISNPNQIKQIPVTSLNGGYVVKVTVNPGQNPKELVAFLSASTKIKAPAKGVTIGNQNLHGITEYPDFVIVTHADFIAQANELANYRRSQGLTVVVTEIDKVFNEFSGGKPDMRAARDYFRFLYDRDANPRKFKYALFMGDGTFDMRGLVKEGVVNKNFIPSYQTDESLYEIQSYTSDDYFGLLDSNEGEWEWIGGDEYSSMERLDIGIGRFPVQTATEAAGIIEKIKKYENPATYGAWRTNYTFVSDNDKSGGRDRGDRDLHLQNADVVAEYIKEIQPNFNINKIHTISYPNETRAEGVRIPEARADVFKSLNEGTLVWNYSGHGGWDGLTDEKIFRIEDIDNEMDNFENLPIFVTATCSFGHWDYVKQQSGGERLLLAKQRGAVAAFTTIRIVVTNYDPFSLNPGLNRAINTYLVTKDESGLPRRLGDVMRLAKNTVAGSQNNNRKFNLLGDPTLRVGMASGGVTFEKINGQTLATPFNIQALQQVTIEGSAKDELGQNMSNGVVEVVLLDRSRRVDVANSIYTDGYYDIQKDVIYRNRATVNNGKFSTTFVVPKDISQDLAIGKLSGYAWNATKHAFGQNIQLKIGGLSNTLNDVNPPKARIFLNDTTFVSGGITHAKPVFIAKLFDENGINTVGSGVGHEMLLTLDGNAVNAIEIGSNFVGDLNRYQSGVVRYQLPEQSVGKHNLSLKVWDVANNSTTQTLSYEVLKENALNISKLYNYPNPMVQRTQFMVEHNQPNGTEAKVSLKIYTLAGRLIRHYQPEEALPSGLLMGSVIQIPWNGRDEDGDLVATGTYIYKMRVEVQLNDRKQVSEKLEKLVIIN